MIRVCAIVPTYDNPRTIGGVVEGLRSRDLEVITIDDGSGSDCEQACQQLQADGLNTVIRLANNRGKVAACKVGFTKARELGFTHVLQIDADGQHDQDQVPLFVATAKQNPTALILGETAHFPTGPFLLASLMKCPDYLTFGQYRRPNRYDLSC